MAKGSKSLEVPKGAIVTPLAADLALSEGISLIDSKDQRPTAASTSGMESTADIKTNPQPSNNVVAFGSDHGGFKLKESLRQYAETLGYKVVDVGTHSEDPCDYPDFAYAVAALVSKGEAWRGVMIDGAGIGSCVVANKVPGVKAACCHNEFVARNAREHNDTNVLTLGSKVVGSEVCKEILRIWLETWFAGGRHKLRVDKIVDVEARFLK